MPFVPDGGGGDSTSGMFSVSPQALQAAAPSYSKVAQDISTLQQSLASIIQLTSGDMYILLEFSRLASMLEQLQARIDAAMECAAIGLNKVSAALEIASQEYLDTDQQVSDTFTITEDDSNPWTTPTPPQPGGVPPTNPQPGVPNPGQSSGVPNPVVPIVPEIP